MQVTRAMTPRPVVVAFEATATQAREALRSHHIKHLPVVNERKQLVGMLSDGDLVPRSGAPPGAASADAAAAALEPRVGALMTAPPLTVNTEAELSEALDLMLEHNVGALPVMSYCGRLVGIVSYGDVQKKLGNLPL